MKLFRILLILVLLLGITVLVACGGKEEEATPAATSAPAETDVPKATETSVPPTATVPPPTATVEPTPTETPDPQANFVEYESEALGISFAYPEDWAILEEADSGQITIATDESLLDADVISEGAGVLLGVLVDPTTSSLGALGFLQTFSDPELGPYEEIEVIEDPVELEINGQEAAQGVYKIKEEGVELQALLTVIVRETAIGFVFGASPEFETYQPVLAEIAKTVVLAKPPEVEVEIGEIAYDETVEGTVISNSASMWQFKAEEGDVVNIVVIPDENLDAIVDVLDESGSSILEDGAVDDSFSQEEISGLELADGSYTISVTGFGGSSGDFQLSLSTKAAATKAETIQPGDVLLGSMDKSQAALYNFTGLAGETLTFVVTPDGELDVVLTLLDAEGNELESLDGSFGEEILEFTPEADGEYVLAVSSYDESAGTFTISLEIESGTSSNTTDISTLEIIPNDVLLTDEGSVAEGEVYEYTVTSPAYQPFSVVVLPNDAFDAIVTIYDSSGELLWEQDFSFGQEEVLFVPPYADEFTIAVEEFSGAAGSFTTVIFTGGLGGAGAVGSTVYAAATLEEGDSEEGHAYPFFALSDQPVLAVVQPSTDDQLDVVLELINEDTDEVVLSIDETYGYERLLFVPPADGGSYYFRVLGFEGAVGSYDIYLLGGTDILFELASGDTVYATFDDNLEIGYTYSGAADETVSLVVTPDETLDVAVEIAPFEGEAYVSVDEFIEGGEETAEYTATEEESLFFSVFGFAPGSYVMFVDSN